MRDTKILALILFSLTLKIFCLIFICLYIYMTFFENICKPTSFSVLCLVSLFFVSITSYIFCYSSLYYLGEK